MRLDLFLKTARLIKRRTGARELCESGRVLVNGREAKPAKEIKQGDIIVLQFSSRHVEIEVLAAPDGLSKRKTPPEELFRVTAETRTKNEKELWNENLS